MQIQKVLYLQTKDTLHQSSGPLTIFDIIFMTDTSD